MLAYKLCRVTMARSSSSSSSDSRQTEEWSVTAMIFVGSSIAALGTATSSVAVNRVWMCAFWLDGLALLPQVLHARKSMYVDEAQVHWVNLTLVSSLASVFFFSREGLQQGVHGNYHNNNSLFFLGLCLGSFIRLSLCITYLDVFVRTSKSYTDLLAPRKRHSSGGLLGW